MLWAARLVPHGGGARPPARAGAPGGRRDDRFFARRRAGVPRQLTAIIEREGDGYVALCPELDIASQGDTVESARGNLIGAVELFLETAHPSEVRRRLHSEVYVTRLDISVG